MWEAHANKSTCYTRVQARELVRQGAENLCQRTSVSVPCILICLVSSPWFFPLFIPGSLYQLDRLLTLYLYRPTRASSVPPAHSLGSGTPMGPGVLPLTLAPSTQPPVVPLLTSATTVPTPCAPPILVITTTHLGSGAGSDNCRGASSGIRVVRQSTLCSCSVN